jgi:hypothetical protein
MGAVKRAVDKGSCDETTLGKLMRDKNVSDAPIFNVSDAPIFAFGFGRILDLTAIRQEEYSTQSLREHDRAPNLIFGAS